MQSLSLPLSTTPALIKTRPLRISAWYKSIEPVLAENQIGIAVSLMLLSVSVAGFNVVLPPMAGASIWAITPGILLVFLSNSMALAQMKIMWVLIGFVLSMLVNGAVSLYYFLQLLQ